MASYITSVSQFKEWITSQGYDFVGDTDRDGEVETAETTLQIDTALAYADAIIDGFLCERMDTDDAKSQKPRWLHDRCVDIAVWRMAGQGGRDIPESIQRAYDNAIAMLEEVRGGRQIPGLTYASPVNAPYRVRLPVVQNPRDGVCGPVIIRPSGR